MHLEYFPTELLELQQEVILHPRLVDRLYHHVHADLEVRLAEIAAYCEVILDGDYTREDIIKLCKILTTKLVEKRTGIVIVEGKLQ